MCDNQRGEISAARASLYKALRDPGAAIDQDCGVTSNDKVGRAHAFGGGDRAAGAKANKFKTHRAKTSTSRSTPDFTLNSCVKTRPPLRAMTI